MLLKSIKKWEKLDYIIERKNIGTEEQFQREVERELGRFGIGTTYEEIMNNIREIRRQIPSTKIIESIIFEVKNNFDKNLESLWASVFKIFL